MIRSVMAAQPRCLFRAVCSPDGGLGPAVRSRSSAETRGGGVADRYCAWAGHSGLRTIFTVVPLAGLDDTDELPSMAGAVVLAVTCEAARPRRVLWAEALSTEGDVSAVMSEVEALAGRGGHELHVRRFAAGDRARESVVADLGFPRLPATKAWHA